MQVGIGKIAGHTAKKVFFVLIVIGITSIYSYSATDVLFFVDSTGSMGGLSNFQTAFSDIIAAIDADSPCPDTIMYALADYKNYADGGNYQAYGVNLDQSFTYSAQDVLSAINALTAGGGRDDPESQLKGMTSVVDNWLTTSGDLDFGGRAEAKKIIVWGGDIYGHIAGDEPSSDGSPPDGYYPTLDETIEALTDQGIVVFALNPSDCDFGLNQAYAGAFNQATPARQQAGEITIATGGTLFCNIGSGSPDISDAIVDAINCYLFIKDDDIDDANDLDCRSPGQELTYSICLTNDSDQTIENASIIDRLPSGVDYPDGIDHYVFDGNSIQFVEGDPNYDSDTHSYLWQLDPIAPDASVCVYLTVVVNNTAEPGMKLHNAAELIIGENVVSTATKDTQVCCWDTGPIIYVDKNAVGNNNGVSWIDAYTDLQDALARARDTQCADVNTIYIADGTYSPGVFTGSSFEIPNGISVYGSFAGIGFPDPYFRDTKAFPTILSGYISQTARNDTVVVMGNDTLLDGATVQDAALFGQGILCEGVDSAITNCTIRGNLSYGLLAENSNIELKWCRIENNGYDGIYHIGNGKGVNVENCQIYDNQWNGLYSKNSFPTIKNTVICRNGMADVGYYGVRISEPFSIPIIYNNTIAYNNNAALRSATSDPNHPKYPDVQNCIIWYNNNGGEQLRGFDPERSAYYCCIQDCNDVNFNISSDPKFAYVNEPNNIHLAYDSPCKNSGNPGHNSGDVGLYDIDSESRIADDRVDMGADEVNCEDVYNEMDWNADGIVNLAEFNPFSSAWLSQDPNDPSLPHDPNFIDPNDFHGWSSRCDLNEDYHVGLADIILFCDQWLWEACWHRSQRERFESMYYAMSGGEEMMSMPATEPETMSEQPMQVEALPAETATPAIVEPAETTPVPESIESIEIDPAAERENLLSLLEDIDALIDDGGDDAQAWQDIKILLEQTLVDMGDTTNDPNSI